MHSRIARMSLGGRRLLEMMCVQRRSTRGGRTPRKRGIQYSTSVSDRAERPRRTGSPAFAGNDSRVVQRIRISNSQNVIALRSSLRAKRSNPCRNTKKKMDCFVASLLAMTKEDCAVLPPLPSLHQRLGLGAERLARAVA